MRVVVSRKTWLRGEGYEVSCLHRAHDGKRCCFGFAAAQCGVSDAAIGDKSTIRALGFYGELSVFRSLDGRDSEETWVQHAYMINDDKSVSGADRESKLSELFAANGHEIVFED